MNLQEKKTQVEELRTAFQGAEVGILTQLNGIDVATVTELRKRLRESQVHFRVVKNTLAKLAAKGTAMEAVSEDFTGPIGLAYGADPVTPAKILAKFIKELPPEREGWLKIKSGMLTGRRLDAASVNALATLPSLLELRGRLVGLLAATPTTLVRLVATPGQQLARVIDAHAKSAGETQATNA